ncbi:MAG: DUF2934 domain-containing protein [Candidatus Omnitrophica bacterium]|nr:DUF2934 domain-containing protein [Candidatus Omnitrophota bacterium]HOX54810.1 DUF2934 domain-containing protein [Candidatus Omnitrophota bacterium]
MFSKKMNSKNNKKRSFRRVTADELSRMIQERAYSYFEQRGYQGGNDLDDWLRAEKEIKKELSL